MTKFSDGFPLSPGGLFQPADNSIYITNATVRVQSPTEPGRGLQLDSTGCAVVNPEHHWKPIDSDTPRGATVWLINKASGVAQKGQYNPNDKFFDHWFPLPTFKKD